MKGLKFWKPLTFDIATFKWRLHERRNKEFIGNGSDKGKATYNFNELGFRGASPKKKGFKIMSVGCSHTEGIDVYDHQTWPAQLSSLISNSVDINLGISGRSNDYIARSVLTYSNEFKPDLILIMYTYPNRKEYYTENGGIEPYHPNPWGYFDEDREGRLEWAGIVSSSNEQNDLMNWYKNHLLITYYLKDMDIPFLWNGTFVGTDYKDENRFDGNYPPLKDTHQHATYLENKEYAQRLYNHIEKLGILKK